MEAKIRLTAMKAIITYLKRHRSATPRELMDYLRVSYGFVYYRLRKLERNGSVINENGVWVYQKEKA